MNFTSAVFLYFCLCFFPVYLLVARRLRWRNLFILGMSYLFYGWWDWRFLILIAVTCFVDYNVARAIEDSVEQARKKFFLWISLASNLGVLAFFKYFNFFVGSGESILRWFGLHPSTATLSIILPVGISFYTFQSIAYVVDVYRGKIRAERDAVLFFAYVSYFPQLAAGPIERAGHLLTQFREVRLPTKAGVTQGVWLVVQGYFTKMVVADTLAPWVDLGFHANQTLGWSTLLATLAFGLQIYGDFKGYSLIAKGVAAFMGFELMWNFDRPYWSTSVQDFWHRWHISLSTWLRDYLFIPLGGSRAGPSRVCLNLMLTMLLGGLWHGAGWNFLIWGGWHGLALCVHYLWKQRVGERKPSFGGWLLTMVVVFIGWFFFRATEAPVWQHMITALGNLAWLPAHTVMLRTIVLVALPVGLLEYLEFTRGRDLRFEFNRFWLAGLEALMLVLIFAASQRPSADFIYFQF